MPTFTLPPLPGELQWENDPLEWKVQSESRLVITAGPRTDWFMAPAGDQPQNDNAPSALFVPPDEHFILSAKVKVDFASDFDAGGLQARERDDLWAKLCFEYSPQGQPMIVSVVTRGVSDDCNSTPVAGNEVYLRLACLSRNAGAFAFHYSLDGRYWYFVRHFALGKLSHLRAGLSSQSPTGEKCRALFSEIHYQARALKDLRNGE
jgi:regulation of enolase protein 1 (concanavalin A-like superfamily)